MAAAPPHRRGTRPLKKPPPERWINQLRVFASKKELAKFLRSHWEKPLHGRFWELQENMRTRFGCQFETESSPLQSLEALSRRWPGLVYVWSWENERRSNAFAATQQRCERIIGVAQGEQPIRKVVQC